MYCSFPKFSRKNKISKLKQALFNFKSFPFKCTAKLYFRNFSFEIKWQIQVRIGVTSSSTLFMSIHCCQHRSLDYYARHSVYSVVLTTKILIFTIANLKKRLLINNQQLILFSKIQRNSDFQLTKIQLFYSQVSLVNDLHNVSKYINSNKCQHYECVLCISNIFIIHNKLGTSKHIGNHLKYLYFP